MRSTIALVSLAVAATAARADSWKSPVERTVKSAQNDYRATIRPADLTRPETRPTILVERAGKKVYERNAVNRTAPVDILVSDDGHVVTLGEWYRDGQDHALVIYSPRGDVVVDRRLEELLDSDDLGKTERSVSSRDWIKRGGEATLQGARVVVPTLWGDEIHFQLSDGAQLRGGRPFVVPTDRERFTEYVTGKRAWTGVSIELHTPTGTRCSYGPTSATCEDGEKHKASYTAKELAQVLAATTALTTALAPHFAPARPGELRTVVTMDFTDATNTRYGYRFHIPEPNVPKDLAASLLALRRLAGLTK